MIAAALIAAPAARADHHDENLPWPQALPALVHAPGHGHPVPNCETPSVACVDDLASRLEAQWRAWDATCDHRAVMALSYLRITQELAREMRAGKFDHPKWMAFLVADFSNRYFATIADYDAGRPVAPAWKIALDAMTKGNTTAAQDVLLFSNAHVGHDYPYALLSQGLVSKHDHDQINEVNTRILDGVVDEIAARYDPSMAWLDIKPYAFDEAAALEMILGWRELTWRNAELLSAGGGSLVGTEINADTTAWATLIAPPIPGWRAKRDAFCQSSAPLGSQG
jgi:hypothetical protein